MKVTDNNTTESNSNKGIESGNFFRNLAGYNEIELYTIWGLIDEIYLSLVCSREHMINGSEDRIIFNKYYHQAWKLERLISAGNPPPLFIIMLSDLNPKIKRALNSLDDDTKHFVMIKAIGRIFENINPKLYHTSIARRLRWKFERTI